MNKSVPAPAALLLDFIAQPESGGGYDVIYGNHQGGLATPITSWSLNTLISAQATWGREWGSSAAGKYQFMPATLRSLIADLGLTGTEIFNPDLQDRLAYQLLIRRGYAKFVSGLLATNDFAKQLAEEWASFPVLAPTQGAHRMLDRGMSYYAGDGLNKAGVSPEKVEAVLARVQSPKMAPFPPTPLPGGEPAQPPTQRPKIVPATIGGTLIAAAIAFANGIHWSVIIFGALVIAVGVVAFTLIRRK